MPLSLFLFSIILELLVSTIKQGKEIDIIRIWIEIIIFVFGGMSLRKKQKIYKLQELVNTFNHIATYKIGI